LGIDSIDSLFRDFTDAWTEPLAKHGKRRKINLRVAVGYSMSKKNQFYRANRELGRIKKTGFILDYMSQPPLRRQIRGGLLKVDRLHSLARDVAYAKRGRITKRDFAELMKTCNCLILILACIIYWQAKGAIARVITECNPQEAGIDISLLEHVSPIEWENVVLYGEYVIDRSWIR